MATDRTLSLSRLRHPKAEPEFAFLAEAYAVGKFVAAEAAPKDLALTMVWCGEQRSGDGRAAMRSPAEAAYLVRELAQRSACLEVGMVVLTGGITALIDLEPSLEIEMSSPQLGSCSLLCT